MRDCSDEDLASLFVNQPERYFQAVYDRYAGPLLRFIYRFTANREKAEEILHDVFVQLLSHRFEAGETGSLKAWLFTLARNKSLNHLKKGARETADESPVLAARSDQDLEAEAIQKNRLQRLQALEDRLPAELGQTWLLRKQGLEYAEIAQKLSIPLGTVKSRFSRLLAYFKEEFKNEC